MLAPWIMDEMKTADLKDKRLDTRLKEVLSQLAAQPTASIPAACGGYAETAAAYRFFDNEKVTFEKVLEPHRAATRERLASQEVAILVQDTTELDVTRPGEQVVGAGPLDGARYGLMLHLLAAFTPDGTPLGTLDARAWARDEQAVPINSLSRAERAATPFTEKESYRWLELLEHACAVAAEAPQTRLICVADSEADIYELLMAGQQEPRRLDWIIRACQNRALARADDRGATSERYVREQALAQPVLFQQTIEVRAHEPKVSCETRPRRQARRARQAEVEVRAAAVRLRGPWRPGEKLSEVDIHVVLVREISPPPDTEPVEWLLMTSLAVDDAEQARQVIEYYRTRWMIEILFRTLKQGCRVEQRRFEHLDRLLPCVAVFLIVAWRTLFVCRLGRSMPEVSCEVVFEPSEWKAAYRVVRRKNPPRTPLSLGEMVRLVAQLGGYINRPRLDPPGPQTVWIGLQRTRDFALCWDLFGPEAKTKSQLV